MISNVKVIPKMYDVIYGKYNCEVCRFLGNDKERFYILIGDGVALTKKGLVTTLNNHQLEDYFVTIEAATKAWIELFELSL